MSGGYEIGFTFMEVRSRQWRTKAWIEATKHRFYGFNVNYEANMVITGRGLNLNREGGEGDETGKTLLVDVGKDHFYVETPTREAMLIAKAMSIVETAVEDRGKAISYVAEIIRRADGARILIDMNYDSMRPE
jgi:hypothetical protein